MGLGVFFWRGVARLGPPAGPEVSPLRRAGIDGMTGLCLLGVFGSGAQFFFGLGFLSVFVLIPAALFGVRGMFRVASDWKFILLVVLCLAFSSRLVDHGDTGNYHLQAALWMSDGPLPLGLANLHGRFGFNSAWWVVSGWFQFPWLPSGASIYFPTGLLGVFAGLLILDAGRSFFKGAAVAADYALLAASYLWFRQWTGINNPSFSTVAPANLFLVVSAASLLRWCERPREELPAFWFYVLTGATAASCKLTALPWLTFSLPASLLFFALRRNHLPFSFVKFLLPAVVISAAVLGVYAGRGVAISGYPFYPMKVVSVNVPWRVSAQSLGNDVSGIRDWPTRDVGQEMSLFQSVQAWISSQFGLTNILVAAVALVAVGLGVMFLLARFGWRPLASRFLSTWPVLLPALIGLAACLIYAPALRFASGYFFALLGALFAVAAQMISWKSSALRLAVLLVFAVGSVIPNARGMISRRISLVAIPELPPPAVEQRVTDFGETIWVSRRHGLSWAAARPSTPYFNPRLSVDRNSSGVITRFSVK